MRRASHLSSLSKRAPPRRARAGGARAATVRADAIPTALTYPPTRRSSPGRRARRAARRRDPGPHGRGGDLPTDLGVKAAWPADAGPLVLGHEGAGVIEAVGAGVSGLRGRRARAAELPQLPGTAGSCRGGHVSYCERFRELNAVEGMQHKDGSTTMHRGDTPVHGNFFGQSSFATHALAYASNTVKVDGGPRPRGRRAARVRDPDRRRCRAQRARSPPPGSSFVVYGAGGVGSPG